jgi:hypothetical protein
MPEVPRRTGRGADRKKHRRKVPAIMAADRMRGGLYSDRDTPLPARAGVSFTSYPPEKMQEIFMPRDDLGRLVPGGNDISPPVAGGQPASADVPPAPTPPPSNEDGDKAARLNQHRGRHA